jgi:F-type H+-transporting ATPase subunit delta
MSVTTVARRYAEALADVAIAHNLVDQLDAELHTFAEMMRTSRELHDVFASPVVSQRDKGKVLDAIIQRTHPNAMTANLLRTMLQNYRLQYLGAVYEQYQREINERRGIVIAEVTTAQPMAAAEQEKLSQRLAQITGKRVQFQFATDPTLIGGVITRVGSVVYDGSVRTKLQGIKHQLKTGER